MDAMKECDLVTGAAGLIGYELTRQLLEAGRAVVAVDCYRKGGRDDLAALARRHGNALTILEADLANTPQALATIPTGIDTVYHFAAIVGVAYVDAHPYETMRVNMLSTLAVLDWAIAAHVRAVAFASSSENYAGGVDRGWVPLPTPEDVPLVITDSALPRWSYAASKTAGESAVFGAAREGGFTPVVIRFHNVYGPRMGPTHVVPEFVERARRRLDPYPVYGYDATRSFLHVDDAVRAVRLVTTSAPALGGTWNVGSAQEVSIAQLLDLVLECAGYHPKVEAHPAPAGSVKRRVPDVSRLQTLGFTPRISLREGIAGLFAP